MPPGRLYEDTNLPICCTIKGNSCRTLKFSSLDCGAIFIYIFLVVLEFKLRASSLLGSALQLEPFYQLWCHFCSCFFLKQSFGIYILFKDRWSIWDVYLLKMWTEHLTISFFAMILQKSSIWIPWVKFRQIFIFFLLGCFASLNLLLC
jgi:hypothetical protein